MMLYTTRLGPQDIRLLSINQDTWTAPITCTLHTVTLKDQPSFTALSYVWGPPNPASHIQVNEEQVGVGRNLSAALRYYRQTGWNSPLWVDALCINQEDLAERSDQVRFIDEIYSAAATFSSSSGPASIWTTITQTP